MSAGTNNNWLLIGNGQQAFEYDSFLSLDYSNTAQAPELPVEDGAFFTGNKWRGPYQAQVTIAKSGQPHELTSLAAALDQWVDSIDLITIVTPYKVYINAIVIDVEYPMHEDSGPGMLIPRIGLKEVRFVKTSASTGEISYQNSKNPEAGGTQGGGRESPGPAESWLYGNIGSGAYSL